MEKDILKIAGFSAFSKMCFSMIENGIGIGCSNIQYSFMFLVWLYKSFAFTPSINLPASLFGMAGKL